MNNDFKNEKVLIVSHVSPDGDAVGSVSAMAWIAEGMGVEAVPFLEEIPENYVPFAHPGIIEDGKVDMESIDSIICVDCSNVERLHLPFGDWENRPDVRVFNIDHHPTNEKYGDENIVNSDMAATCQMIAARFKDYELGFYISKEVATALYMGLLTDTGCFRFSNTSSAAYDTASYLISKGADHEKVIESLYFSKTKGQIAFESHILATGVYHYDGKLLCGLVKAADFSKYDIDPSMVEESTQKLQEVRGVKVAIRLIEAGTGIRISFRSKDSNIDVSKVAMEFGGGGHKMSAGAFIANASLESAMEQIADAFEGILSV